MKKFNIIFIILILVAITIGVYENCEVNKDTGEPYITIIPDTSGYILNGDAYVEYYVIVNPPEDLQELKDLIKKYDSNNPAPEETEDGKKPSSYGRQFLGETKHTPRNWKPTNPSDTIEDHYDDVIAKFSWKREDTKKNYVLWKKDKNLSREILGELRCTE